MSADRRAVPESSDYARFDEVERFIRLLVTLRQQAQLEAEDRAPQERAEDNAVFSWVRLV